MINYVQLRHVIVGVTFTVVALLVSLVAHRPSHQASRLGLRGLKRKQAIEQGSVWVHVEPLVRWLGVQTSRFVSAEAREKLDLRLTHAGDVLGLTADEYAATGVLGGFVGLGVGAVVRHFLPAAGIAAPVMGACLGAVIPSLLVDARMRARQLGIQRGLPYVLDVLSLALGAGSDFTGAIHQVVEKARSNEDLREEFAFFLQQLQVGQSRISALRELTRRVPITSVRELTLAVEQAEERGNSLSATLETQAKTSRSTRSNEAEKAAESATSKMVFPTMGFSALGLYFLVSAIGWFEGSITNGLMGAQ